MHLMDLFKGGDTGSNDLSNSFAMAARLLPCTSWACSAREADKGIRQPECPWHYEEPSRRSLVGRRTWESDNLSAPGIMEEPTKQLPVVSPVAAPKLAAAGHATWNYKR